MPKSFTEWLSYLWITLGALLASFSVACILLPNDAIDYGTAGIAIIINKLTGINLSVCVICILIPFLILGFIYLGKEFFMKALLGSVAYTIGLEVFEKVPFELNTEHFIAVVFGGAILGAGLSMILRCGGCIDGSEIFANILMKKIAEKTKKNYPLTTVLLIFNACVYITVFLVIDQNAALLSLLVYVVATTLVDHMTDRFESVKQVTIVTKVPEMIVPRITDEMHTTCTMMDSQGAIAGNNKTIICYVNYFELERLKEILEETDGGAYCTISTIDEIMVYAPKKKKERARGKAS